METPRSSSLLPTIKCSNCAVEIQISLLADHICTENGQYYKATSSKNLQNRTFLQVGPHTLSSISSSSANPGRLPFSNLVQKTSSSFTTSTKSPGFSTLSQVSTIAEFPFPRSLSPRPYPSNENECREVQIQGRSVSNLNSNQLSAPVNSKIPDKNGFLQRVNNIAPGPFDINRKRDLLNSTEYNHFQKVTASSSNDTVASKADRDKINIQKLSNQAHFRSTSRSSSNTKIGYAILPKVPRKNGYDGFGPPTNDSNMAISQNSHDNHRQSLELLSNSDSGLRNKEILQAKYLIDKIKGLDSAKSMSSQGSILSGGLGSRKNDKVPRLLPQKNMDKLPPLPVQSKQSRPLPVSPHLKLDELSPLPQQEDTDKNHNRESIHENNTKDSSLEQTQISNYNEGSVVRSSDTNTSLKHYQKPTDFSKIDLLMEDLENSINKLGPTNNFSIISPPLSPPLSQSSSSQTSISTNFVYTNDSNDKSSPFQQYSTPILSSPFIPMAAISASPKHKIKLDSRPLISKQNSLPIISPPTSPIDRTVQSGLSSPNLYSRSRTHSLCPKPKVSKGSCKRCKENIYGKSVSSTDGRLTGRYHKKCFGCSTCQKPFKTATCYVINDAPYCEIHYHEINGSICSTCNKGIEGKYIETERGQKHHTNCLRCADCRQILRKNYFEMSSLYFCKRDAYQRAQQKLSINSDINAIGRPIERQPKRSVMN